MVWGVVGLLLTVMILSYLIGDNFFFRFAAYLFVGVTAGFMTVLIIKHLVWPYFFQPLISGTWHDRLWVLIPLALAISLVVSQFSRWSVVGRVPLAFLAGLTAAITIGGAVFGTIIPQLRAVVEAFDPVRWYQSPGRPWVRIAEALVMLIGVVGTLSYFHFGLRRRQDSDTQAPERPRVIQTLGKVGEVFIGVALGAVFAGVFSTALLAMIDRIMFIGQFVSRLFGGR